MTATSASDVHTPEFKRLSVPTDLFVFLPDDLRSTAGSYGNLSLKVVRLSVDSNDVLIPDLSLMQLVYGLRHQNATTNSSSYCIFVTYLHFFIPPSDRVFSPRKAFRQSMFHTPNPCGSSAFEDKSHLSLQCCS